MCFQQHHVIKNALLIMKRREIKRARPPEDCQLTKFLLQITFIDCRI